jgi:hypothetical protein
MSINTTVRNAMVTACAAEIPAGSSLVVYDGVAPASVDTALSGNNVLATFTTAGFGTATTGSITASAITGVTATGTGTATFVRALVAGTPVYQANVGSGVSIDNANIFFGGDVNITSWSLTMPAA